MAVPLDSATIRVMGDGPAWHFATCAANAPVAKPAVLQWLPDRERLSERIVNGA
jgi:hypothetical protein